MNRDLTDIVRDNESSIFNALSRHAKSISRFSNLYSTFLCPLEAPDLLNRFCETCFDQSPLPIEASSYSGKVSVNKSIGLGFADALRNEVVSRGLSFKGFDRRRIVRLAKRWKLPKEISELMPSAYIVDQLAKGIDSISGYKSLLLDYKVDPAIVSITIDKARSRFEQQISKPIATTSQKINLAENAKALFDEALRELN